MRSILLKSPKKPPARIFSKTALLPPLLLFRYDSTPFK